ncbi:LacI family DNA-binding transcriptional regulator [Methylobacterium sp. PvR107]|uniref:LacI family DNA-binding transcriptional regulator n=1 Tax=Methylobacterium sp. PvR107 TaxID=2806597 RepID=UPI001AE4E085|nr:LacI family DNA-binding transcriptional regulator [Methylobacterium sp. PvR107]MBP1183701.1 LacI family gluconate utilization system Gnt-I transcriptional repressor [Methylobacterium sp. PvR107]
MDDIQPPGRLVTLTDVAREAGVGESTVSRVLRNHGSYSKRAGERVAEAVARLGYVPNRLAGSLAGQGASARLVGVVIPSLANVVFPDLLRGLTAALDAEGIPCVIGVSDYDPDREEALAAALLSWRPAALLLTGLEHNPGTVVLAKAGGVRVIEMIDTDGDGIDTVVGFSNRAVGAASARHLVARGYRRIAYLGHDLRVDLRAGKRLSGFEDALTEAGLSLRAKEVRPGPSSPASGRAGLEALLARVPDLDAVYFSNDDMALGGYFACLSAGLAVPGRIALFGFNGLDFAAAMPQPLSTVRTPRLEIGRQAAACLTGDGPKKIDLGFELIEGATA